MNTRILIVLLFSFILNSCQIEDKTIPDDFNISLKFDERETVSTFDSTYRRQYNFHDTIIKLVLTKEEKSKIFNCMNSNDVMNLPSNFEIDTTEACIVPSSKDYLVIQFENKKKSITYSYACNPKDKKSSEKYLQISSTIKTILKNKQEIKKLPESDMIFL